VKEIFKFSFAAYFKIPTSFFRGCWESFKTLFGIDNLRVNNYSRFLPNVKYAIHSAARLGGKHFYNET